MLLIGDVVDFASVTNIPCSAESFSPTFDRACSCLNFSCPKQTQLATQPGLLHSSRAPQLSKIANHLTRRPLPRARAPTKLV